MEKRQRLEEEKRFQDDRTLNKEDKRFIIDYDTLWDGFSKRLLKSEEKDILALGSGTGNYEIALAKLRNMITSVDRSPESIKALTKKIKEKKAEDNVKAMIMDAEELKFDDGSFDVIYGIAILHHLYLEKVMPELQSVMKDGGKLLFVEPPKSNFRVRRYRAETPHMRSKFEHPLSKKDFRIIRKYFPDIRVNGYYLLQTFMPKMIRHSERYSGIRSALDHIDRLILAVFPSLRLYCYRIIIELRNVSNKCAASPPTY